MSPYSAISSTVPDSLKRVAVNHQSRDEERSIMAKRRKGRHRSKGGPSDGQRDAREIDATSRELSEPFDRRRIEGHSARSNRLLRSREWETLEQANAIVQEWIDAGSPEPDVELTAVERAQDVMYDAFDARGRKRARLARKALGISPECADAYVVLAEETARTPEQARDLYAEGVAAGDRALGPDVFDEYEGQFWGALETRPYMRARAGLAGALWNLGDVDGAVAEYRGLLDLNPDDNQGIRILLSSLLAEEGRDEELEALLDEYEGEISCNWPYSRALLAFRREGPTDRANDLLDEAVEANPFVPLFVLELLPLPEPPPYVTPGGPDEAVGYTVDNALAWWRTEGAAEWMAERSLPLDELLPEDL